ncbi:MAG: sigma-70 family RNA polymerase sigma factor [Hyphomicrobiales bacterium]|nr:sigma-70 family RNA polymerase sigma factor [Hyphomicrobiales bacterium]
MSADGPGRDPESEADLVARLRKGDAAAHEALVRAHITYLLRVARNILRDDALAEDCVQEAFLSAFAKIDTFEGRSSIRSWLRRITMNAALMKLRSAKRRDERPIEDFLPEFDRNGCRIEPPWTRLATPEEIAESNDRRALVKEKVAELPEAYRTVLVLRDFEELSTREVAETLGLSEAAVRVRLHRARAALKALLEPLLRGEIL